LSNISTVAAVLAKDLAALGARRCFGLLGTANFKISHGLVEAGVELISARHEGNAASMADAYAKATGELTLVSVHSGPGLTNAITGIGEAAKSRTPLLVLAGDVPTGNVKSNFYFEQAELVRSVGAVSERTHTPQSARSDLLRAVTRALRDRQTVVLSLPLDVQDAKLNGTNAPLELTPMPGRLQGARSFWPGAEPCCRTPKSRSSRLPIVWVRCSQHPFAAMVFLLTIHGRLVFAAAFPHRPLTR
jgi:thiamine pyrophosphate-dependent acetolactate synthase large subunit-like protein